MNTREMFARQIEGLTEDFEQEPRSEDEPDEEYYHRARYPELTSNEDTQELSF